MVSLREVSTDWSSITTNDLITGLKYNTGFVSGGYEPVYFIGDKSITASYENNSIQNCTQVLCALLRDNADLTIKTIATTGESRYTIGKASDIKYVSRYIDSYLVSVSNTYTAVIPEDVSEMIGRYDARFTSNNLDGKLICRITSDSVEYLRAFIISSQTITLKDIVTGSNSGISTLSINDRFELINAYDILEEGLEETTGYPVQGFVKKHVKPSEDTSYIEFGIYDKPAKLSGDYVCISYNKLDDYNQTFIYDNSINKYGIFTKKEDLNISVTQEQINLIESTLQKLTEPKITIELETFRPTRPQKGWMINVDVQNIATGVFEVINVSETYIYPDGQLIDKPFRLWKVTLSNYKNNLASVLAGLKRKNTMSQAKLADNQILRTFINLSLRYRFIDDPSEFTLDAPVAIDADPINNDDFTAKWQSVANADDYILFAALDNTFATPVTGFAGLLTGNVLSRLVDGQDVTDNSTFYYKVKAVNLALGLESDWSNVIEVNKIVLKNYVTDANTLLYYRFQDGSGTNINDETANNRDSTIIGTTSWQSGIITYDTSSLYLSGNGNTNTGNFNPAVTDFTARISFRFNTGDKASKSTHILIARYDTLTGISNPDGADFICEFDPTVNKFIFSVYQTNTLYRAFEASYTVLENTNYSVQFAFKLNNSGSNLFEICVNGVKLTTTLNYQNTTNITNNQNSTIPLMVGAYRASSGTYYRGQFRVLRVAFDNDFRTESEALTDYNNLFV